MSILCVNCDLFETLGAGLQKMLKLKLVMNIILKVIFILNYFNLIAVKWH